MEGKYTTFSSHNEADLFNQGQPTVVAFGQRDVRQGQGSLPVTERISEIAFGVPWFKHDDPEIIGQYASLPQGFVADREAGGQQHRRVFFVDGDRLQHASLPRPACRAHMAAGGAILRAGHRDGGVDP